MIWLVEEYDDYVKDLVVEIEKQGHKCDFINYYKMKQDDGYMGVGMPKGCGNYPDDECVIFYGSIQTAQWLLMHKKWIPTVWYTFANYKCSKYYATLGKFLLNNNYSLLPQSEVKRRWKELYKEYGEDGCIFLRPDAGVKSFSGRIFEQERFIKDYENLVEPNTTIDSLVVVSTPKKIDTEWRFICAGNEIITGSQYKEGGSNEIIAGYPMLAGLKCQHVINAGYHPDAMYSVDICQTHRGDYALVEIGNFCCAGLYACNLASIVKKASELAIAEHKEYARLL